MYKMNHLAHMKLTTLS